MAAALRGAPCGSRAATRNLRSRAGVSLPAARPSRHAARAGSRRLACAAVAMPFVDDQAAASAASAAVRAANLQHVPPAEPESGRKTRVVVLGSGWGAASLITNLDPAAFGEHGDYELVLVSPRNHMVYTPLLPSAVGGVVSENSIVESIRTLMQGKGIYYEARATNIDPYNRRLTLVKDYCEACARRKAAGKLEGGAHGHSDADHELTIPFDILVCSVGAVNATFGIKGVQDHCFFLKTMEDAKTLRRHISKALELAALPDVSPEQRRRMLQFVICGGGPTGVETAAELMDLVSQDIAHHMPRIKEDVSITLVDGMDNLLSSYDKEIQEYARGVFEKSGIKLRLGCRVTQVLDGQLEVQTKEGATDLIPFSTCVWAAGIAMHPLVASLKEKLPAELQTSRRGLLVDEHLRVVGSQGTIYCLGDAAVTGTTPQTTLPPTAQVAKQQGLYLAALLNRNKLALRPAYSAWPGRSSWPSHSRDEHHAHDDEDNAPDLVPLPEGTKPFSYFHMGALCYLGNHQGVMDLPFKTPFLRTLKGTLGGQTWKGLETIMQISHRTRWLVTHDWLRNAVFGRNISNI